jgi:penicillin-binding protein 1C
MRSVLLRAILLAVGSLGGLLLVCTLSGRMSVPAAPEDLLTDVHKVQLLDRHGEPLTQTYRNLWNYHDRVPLHQVPPLLQRAFIAAEDQRFYGHSGLDAWARLHALWQNLRAGRVVRGASTISEQVVRMIHPRPRTVWSRWLEGFDALRLERCWIKPTILEFYLNQVPYSAHRRGVAQAARYYFDRDLETLSPKEMLALAVLVRAPSYLDPYRNPEALGPGVKRLADRLNRSGDLSDKELTAVNEEPLALAKPRLPVQAGHFARHVTETVAPGLSTQRTTLDAGIQRMVQQTLDQRIEDLADRRVANAAALVVAHGTREVLAWANSGQSDPAAPHREVDAVLAPRQPGSALKPFLYALALERGWTAATLIEDAPLQTAVGAGLHTFHNYSRTYYGPVSLRDALGNSLNTPAVRTLRFVGVNDYLTRLHALGFRSLSRPADFYGEGLALGNGEVSLFELVQAYTTLACRGRFAPLNVLAADSPPLSGEQLFPEEIASLIAHILSDPAARQLEFGTNSALNLPQQTAVKSGTSSDFRDAWAVGFNSHYTVGVWMGNLDATPTNGVSGSIGPMLALRTIFARLNAHEETRPLYRSPQLVQRMVDDPAVAPRAANPARRSEWFVAGTMPITTRPPAATPPAIVLRRPSEGLQLAMDPRIPDDREAFEFLLEGVGPGETVIWELDGREIQRTRSGRYLWPLRNGTHRLKATVFRGTVVVHATETVAFEVK